MKDFKVRVVVQNVLEKITGKIFCKKFTRGSKEVSARGRSVRKLL